MTTYSDTGSSDASDLLSPTSSSSSCPSPTKPRRRPPTLRLNPIGVDAEDVIGKVLTRVRRSAKHPTLTLDFSDNTTFQVLIDGYDPVHRGAPKELDMDSPLRSIFAPPGGQARVHLPVLNCAFVTLTDRAFQRRAGARGGEDAWSQNHQGVAFKFAEETPRWHCVWAMMQEYDEKEGQCVFRSYDDVYLERLHRSPRPSGPRKGGRRRN